MDQYLGNMTGWESIIGRSIHVTLKDTQLPVACCTIGEDKDPHAKAEPAQPAYSAAYNPGYGYYGGAGAGQPSYGGWGGAPRRGGYGGGRRSSRNGGW